MEGMRDRSREAIVCAGVGETAEGRQKERRKERNTRIKRQKRKRKGKVGRGKRDEVR